MEGKQGRKEGEGGKRKRGSEGGEQTGEQTGTRRRREEVKRRGKWGTTILLSSSLISDGQYLNEFSLVEILQ